MRYLHTMIRVGDLDAAIDFFCNKLGLVAQVMWAQVRPTWLPHDRTFI